MQALANTELASLGLIPNVADSGWVDSAERDRRKSLRDW
jgi:hypothetical protein